MHGPLSCRLWIIAGSEFKPSWDVTRDFFAIEPTTHLYIEVKNEHFYVKCIAIECCNKFYPYSYMLRLTDVLYPNFSLSIFSNTLE
jgi:hypothetical protein